MCLVFLIWCRECFAACIVFLFLFKAIKSKEEQWLK
jgi:hypothetical protein